MARTVAQTRTPGRSAVQEALERTVRGDWARVLANVAAISRGDLQLAEDAVQEAVLTALERWRRAGVPDNPSAWLTTAARRKLIDRVRREQTLTRKLVEIERDPVLNPDRDGLDEPAERDADWPDQRLKLVFTCCHPARALEAQIALTLRLIGGLSTEEIARALVPEATMAKRLVRAKTKIRDAVIPYRIPGRDELAARTEGVLRVLYLIFNEGYAPTSSDAVLRQDLCAEAIRLTRLIVELLPQEPEAKGLLALMLLIDSRRAARSEGAGELLLLEEQDRSLWDAELIRAGSELIRSAAVAHRPGPYQVQAAIAALHAEAAAPETVDWPQIAALYGRLYEMVPTPVVALNLAAATGMADGPDAGLARLDAIEGSSRLASYHYLHAARADLQRRAGRFEEASRSYERALMVCANAVESRYLRRRLEEVISGR